MNPFSVQTPETMSAEDLVGLFVPIAVYDRIQDSGHLFVSGHRGSGKSMLLRQLGPDCQVIHRKSLLVDLPFFGVYFSIKASDLDIQEFGVLGDSGREVILSEHALVCYFSIKILKAIADHCSDLINSRDQMKELVDFLDVSVVKRLRILGWEGDLPQDWANGDAKPAIDKMIDILDSIYTLMVGYLRRLPFGGNSSVFTGPLLGFHEFLLPLLKQLKTAPFIPGASIYLLIDDADNLTYVQTQVLNNWVSYRSTDVFSLKISTQLNYKTMLTTSGRRIEMPHDCAELTISSVYTGTSKDDYHGWVKTVVDHRLKKYGISASPEQFFPEDLKQAAKIKAIRDEISANWEAQGRGFRPGDDAYRYARAEYIRQLVSSSKQGSKYLYAGFNQLVHVSSGIIRYFLDSAALMYAEQNKKNGGKPVDFIAPTIQSKALRQLADELMFDNFERFARDTHIKGQARTSESMVLMNKLRNVILTLGALFQRILMDGNRSEQRVFSFALSDEPDLELNQILEAGIQYGFFYVDTIGTKEGLGRTKLYVLTRRLAPFFKLDPIGFSGYQFVTSDFLRKASEIPKSISNQIKKYGPESVVRMGGNRQIPTHPKLSFGE